MAQLSNVGLHSNQAIMQVEFDENTYSKAMTSKAIDNGIDGRVRYRQEVKGNVQQLHECFSLAEAGR